MNDSKKSFSKKKLAILVPYRDCFEELLQFAAHIKNFLSAQHIPHHIFIINQVDRFRFNRASLINVGFLYTKNKFDYLVIHDIDLLPLNKNLSYYYPIDGVLHISAPWLHPLDLYENYLGGILIVKNKDFEMVNGMSSHCWGWGLEDDEFREQILKFGLKINRPKNITTGPSNTFLDTHKVSRQRDSKKCLNQSKKTMYHREQNDGLNSTFFNIKGVKELTVDGSKVTVINVELKCDKKITPWCEC